MLECVNVRGWLSVVKMGYLLDFVRLLYSYNGDDARSLQIRGGLAYRPQPGP